MRTYIATAAVAAALTGFPALAQEVAQPDAVRIEMDQEAKAFVFMIDDEPVASLDKSGITVLGDMRFGGNTEDIGAEGVKARLSSNSAERGRHD